MPDVTLNGDNSFSVAGTATAKTYSVTGQASLNTPPDVHLIPGGPWAAGFAQESVIGCDNASYWFVPNAGEGTDMVKNEITDADEWLSVQFDGAVEPTRAIPGAFGYVSGAGEADPMYARWVARIGLDRTNVGGSEFDLDVSEVSFTIETDPTAIDLAWGTLTGELSTTMDRELAFLDFLGATSATALRITLEYLGEGLGDAMGFGWYGLSGFDGILLTQLGGSVSIRVQGGTVWVNTKDTGLGATGLRLVRVHGLSWASAAYEPYTRLWAVSDVKGYP